MLNRYWNFYQITVLPQSIDRSKLIHVYGNGCQEDPIGAFWDTIDSLNVSSTVDLYGLEIHVLPVSYPPEPTTWERAKARGKKIIKNLKVDKKSRKFKPSVYE
ncbi:uncharacterized protein LAJ45_01153 [Morchella importuna]|uniref:uncharacterized protein n=1 Tax=Morchella importuna TaxID=1174673 RepID=UPI001E8DF933|nr:uncharacterized protein LAJ45_01153 [Morchella importuna]KAH8154625.1 hypothetical protein LAJ45_01153 [Morchella importuna]